MPPETLTRAQIIASNPFGVATTTDETIAAATLSPEFAAPISTIVNDPISEPVPDDKDVDEAENGDTDDTDDAKGADSNVSQAVAALGEAIAAVESAQAADPDNGSDPNDAKVDDAIAKLKGDYAELQAAQVTDVADADDDTTPADDEAAPKGDPSDGQMAAKPSDALPPATMPVDDDGNIKPEEQCSNPDCGHPAAMHANDPENGDNSGACAAEGCECAAMELAKIQGQISSDDSTSSGGGVDNADGGDTSTGDHSALSRGTMAVDDGGDGTGEGGSPAPAPEAALADPDLNPAPFVPGSDNMGPAFTVFAIIEGQMTEDGRALALDSLEWDAAPFALMGLDTATHDPSGMSPNDPAVLVGRIDSWEPQPGESDTSFVVGRGFFLTTDDGMHFADLLNQMGRLPVSGDVTVTEEQVTVGDIDEFGMPTDVVGTVVKGKLRAATILPHGPAFPGCYIVLGDGTDGGPAAIPQATEEAPGMVTASAQVVHWMTDFECEPCLAGIDSTLVASVEVVGGGPAHPPASWFANPMFEAGDGRVEEIYSFRPRGVIVEEGELACPMTVTADGRVFGHILAWSQCHVGYPNQCVTAPHSKTDYALFRQHDVTTAEGDVLRLGTLTASTTHANERANKWEALNHYANTGYAVADVNIGEDAYGVWVAGAIRPGAVVAQIEALRRSPQSGDWRNDELVASLAVNTPGFPLAFVSRGNRTLVAAGSFVTLASHKETLLASGATREEVSSAAFVERSIIRGFARIVRRDALRSINSFFRSDSLERISRHE